MTATRILVGAVLLAVLFGCGPFEPFEFTTFNLDAGRLGQAYSDTIHTAGGHGNVSMRVTDGQLPPGVGLRLDDRHGVLYGQPSRTGDFQFTVEARDSSSSDEPDPADIITQGFAIRVDSL
jgi:hypothetical protein